jgi:uncharacterized membrane protein (DUF106 family)
MINAVFPFLNYFDSIFKSFLPLWAVLSFWGIMSGAFVMGVYRFLSPQKKLAKIKAEIKDLKSRMNENDKDFKDVLRLSWLNLKKSFELLGQVLLPSLASSIPAIIMILWISTFYGYAQPESGQTLRIDIVPIVENFNVVHAGRMISREGSSYSVKLEDEANILFVEDGKTIYSGIPVSPPVGSVTKKTWWNLFLSNPGGYLQDGSKTDRVRFHFERQRILNGVPGWMSHWELTYLVSLFISAVFIKIVFKIQ